MKIFCENGKKIIGGESRSVFIVASDVSLIENLDELEVYGTDNAEGTTISSFVFEVSISALST